MTKDQVNGNRPSNKVRLNGGMIRKESLKWLENCSRRQGLSVTGLIDQFAFVHVKNDVGLDLTPGGINTYLALEDEKRRDHRFPDEASVRDWADRLVDPAGISDREGRVTHLNLAWYEFTGASAGASWQDFVHPDDLARLIDTFREKFEARQEYTLEYRVKHRDGSYRLMRDHAYPYKIANVFGGFMGSAKEVPNGSAVWNVTAQAADTRVTGK
jgi:PAS domain S-box-containing protein